MGITNNALLLGLAVGGALMAIGIPLIPAVGDLAAISFCVAFIALYAVASVIRHRSGEELSLAADEVYLLGYLYTFSAFLGIGFRGWAAPAMAGYGQKELLFLASTKLSTTVVGLIGMLWLKSLAAERKTDMRALWRNGER